MTTTYDALTPLTGALGTDSLALGAGYLLVGPWQPIILLVPIAAWAWLVSTVLDKHAARFYLGRGGWNTAHMIFGMLALAAGVLMPIPGIVGFLVAFFTVLILLALDIVLFVMITNRNEKVPEHARLTLDFSQWSESRDAKKAAKQAGSSELAIRGKKGPVPVPDKESPDFAVRVAAEQVVIGARDVRASQVDILPAGEQGYAISMLVDGVRRAGDAIAPADAIKIIDFWKGAAGLDVEDRRRKQSAEIAVNRDGENIDVHVSTSGGSSGMRLTLLFNRAQAVRRKYSELGLLDGQEKALDAIVKETGGIVLLSSPSDGGRTTTLYTLLRQHDAYTSNVQTLELDPEDMIEGVRQNVFGKGEEEQEFSKQLRSMLRRDPNVVGVAEVPDVDTAKETAKCDHERTRVYLSMKADSAMLALQIYLKAVGDPKLAAEGLKGIVGQRLARKLCENCRVPYQPPEDLLKKLGLPAGKVAQLYKKGGQVLIRNKPEVCPVCNGVGYDGQIGVFEVFPLNAGDRAMIAKQDLTTLQTELRKRQLPTVQQAALRRVVEGVTSVEEVGRITATKKSK